MCKSAAILFLAFFAVVTLSVACEEKKPDNLQTQPLKSLAGKKLLVGMPNLKKGATRIAIHHAAVNTEPLDGPFVTYVDLEAPVQQEQVEAFLAFRKEYPSDMDSAIFMEVLESDLTDRNNRKFKVRLLGTAYYPGEHCADFVDADLKDQPYLPFPVTKPKADDPK